MNLLTSFPRRLRGLSAYLGAHRAREHFVTGLLLAALTLILHGNALNGFWRWDDGFHLAFVARFSPWEYFFVPDINRAFAGVHLTPWNPFFYDLNLLLFGMQPKWHYAHMLALLFLGSVLLYMVLRQWLPWPAALAGASALLLGKPTVHIAQGLMHGHYATGLVLALLAVLGWVRYVNGGRARCLWLAVVCFLLATTCKEVYVPLLVLLPFLPGGTVLQRLRAFWPFVVVAVFYVGWRYTVLGHVVGGYRPGWEGFDIGNSLRQLASIPLLLAGPRWMGFLELAIFFIFLVLAMRQKRINWALLTVLASITLLPIVPLTVFPGINAPNRYLFAFWVAVASVIAAAWPAKPRTHVQLILGATLFVLMGVEHIRERERLKPDLVYWDTLYRAVLSNGPRQQVIYLGSDNDCYKALVFTGAQMAQKLIEHDKPIGGPALLADSPFFILNFPSATTSPNPEILQYDGGRMVPVTQQTLAEIGTKWREMFARGSGKEISVEVHFKNGRFHWKFRPYPGHYYVWTNIISARVISEGQSPLPTADLLSEIAVCYVDLDAHWASCSPRLRLSPNGKSVHWSGPGVSVPEPIGTQ